MTIKKFFDPHVSCRLGPVTANQHIFKSGLKCSPNQTFIYVFVLAQIELPFSIDHFGYMRVFNKYLRKVIYLKFLTGFMWYLKKA